MALFKPNQPVVQADPTVKVDDGGNLSNPVDFEVIVQAAKIPTAVIEMVDANGQHLDPKVEFGKTFVLSGAKSSDIAPGKVVEYRFTLLPRT